MSILPMTDTVPEFPAITGTLGRCAPGMDWRVCRVTSIDEVSDILDHLENLGVREIRLERTGNCVFEIYWR
jgi:hypothetical protein